MLYEYTSVCINTRVCFRAVRLQWSLPVEPSSPATSERPSEDTATDTRYGQRCSGLLNLFGVLESIAILPSH